MNEARDGADMLSLSSHLPEQAFAPGQVVVREGDAGGAIRVLVAGALAGKVSVLLNARSGVIVQATEPSVLHRADDGAALLASHPAITRRVAEGQAERLNAITIYRVDLKQQYGNAPGLSMVSEVLSQLSQRQAAPARPSSARHASTTRSI